MLTISEENKTKASALIAAVLVIAAGLMVYKNFTRVETELTKEETNLTSETSELKDILSEKKDGEVSGATATGGESVVWMARPIEKETMKDVKTYVVQKGDTLWEIAKGKYGNGTEWKRILEANKDNVGFLPNGSQALIRVGQTLILPD